MINVQIALTVTITEQGEIRLKHIAQRAHNDAVERVSVFGVIPEEFDRQQGVELWQRLRVWIIDRFKYETDIAIKIAKGEYET